MMINKRLIGAVPESKKYIAGNVALQWCSLCANIAMMSAVTELFAALFAGSMTQSKIVTTAVIALAAVAVRYARGFCKGAAQRLSRYRQRIGRKTSEVLFVLPEYKFLNTGIIVRDLWHSLLTIPLFRITI